MNEHELDCLPDWREAILSARYQLWPRCFEYAHVWFSWTKVVILLAKLFQINSKGAAKNSLLLNALSSWRGILRLTHRLVNEIGLRCLFKALGKACNKASTIPLLMSDFALVKSQVVFKIVASYRLLSITNNQYITPLFSENGMECSRLVCACSIVPARHCCAHRSCSYNLSRFA